jgi:S-adenosylhomocysteine hydrolase
VEDILAIIFIFGGGIVIAVSFSPIGKAIADRLRGSVAQVIPSEEIDEVRAQLQGIQEQVSELAERQDFTERLLAKSKDKTAIGPAKEAT